MCNNEGYNITGEGVYNGQVIAGGSMTFMSGVVINNVPFVPEPRSIISLLGIGAMGLVGFAWRRRRLADG